MNEHRILCFAGSLRADSYNRLLPWAAEAAPEGMTIETFDLVPIPLYNQDLDVGNGPELVARFREAISRANGLRIATPESRARGLRGAQEHPRLGLQAAGRGMRYVSESFLSEPTRFWETDPGSGGWSSTPTSTARS